MKKIRPIDATAMARKIREYMDDYKNAPTRLAVCRYVLSMLGDKNQTPTICLSPSGEPLTLEQLREMDGQPVWVEDLKKPERSAWRLICWDRGKYLAFIAKSADGYILEEYGLTWLAYAYPPAHIDRDAWEPCEWCGEWIGGDCRPIEQDAGYKLYAGYCKQVAADDFYEDETEELNYCPKCGRPLTEEAWVELEKRLMGCVK